MKFTVQREIILKPLQLLSSVVERRQTLPILSNILLRISPDGLAMTATDLEVELVIHIPIDAVEAGNTTLPARKFMDICRALPDGARLEMHVENERVVIRSGKSRFVLATLPPDGFPNVDEMRPKFAFTIEQSKLKYLIDRTYFAMAHQDVRYYLNGLLLELGSGVVRTVATDGHRLAYCQLEVSIDSDQNQQVIVPRKGIAELQKLLSNDDQKIGVEVSANHLRVSTPELRFTTKLIDGRFPDYQRVIPQATDKTVIANRETLRQAALRTSILTNEKYRSIRFQLEPGVLTVLAHNPEQEEAEEEVTVDYQGTGLEIGFNSTYILDALAAVEEETVELRLSDANNCCLVQGLGNNRSKYVVMPMRL